MKILWAALFLWCISNVASQANENELELTEGDVRFFLHTRDAGEIELTENNLDKIDIQKPTKLIIHGWVTDHTAFWERLLTDAFLRKGDYNVILVDWSPIAVLDLDVSAEYTPIIGAYIGSIISQLQNELSFSLQDIHVIGHSMGAAIIAYVGKTVINLTGSKVGRITGLDPRSQLGDEDNRLTPNDAELVDIINTDSEGDNIPIPLGHINFFPNGGTRPQPGCTAEIDDSIDPCSHMRSTYLFAEEMENSRGFLGTRCDTFQDFIEGQCRTERRLTMGSDLKASDAGNYYFYTNAKYPYAVESTVDV